MSGTEEDPDPYGRKPYLSLLIVMAVLIACAAALIWGFFAFIESFGAWVSRGG
jgi:hypothetical protein